MIEVFDAKNIFDFFYELSEKDNSAFVYFTNTALDNCTDQAVIDSVYQYYSEFLPEDLLLIIQAKNDNIIKFLTLDAARVNAASWFPSKEQLGDLSDEYYFKCYVIDKQGICWQN